MIDDPGVKRALELTEEAVLAQVGATSSLEQEAIALLHRWYYGTYLSILEENVNTLAQETVALLSSASAESAQKATERDAADAARLDWLEREVEDDPLCIHNIPVGGKVPCRGLGLKPTGRTLRQAIDAAMKDAK